MIPYQVIEQEREQVTEQGTTSTQECADAAPSSSPSVLSAFPGESFEDTELTILVDAKLQKLTGNRVSRDRVADLIRSTADEGWPETAMSMDRARMILAGITVAAQGISEPRPQAHRLVPYAIRVINDAIPTGEYPVSHERSERKGFGAQRRDAFADKLAEARRLRTENREGAA